MNSLIAVYWRDTSAGMPTLPYYLAKVLADVPRMIVAGNHEPPPRAFLYLRSKSDAFPLLLLFSSLHVHRSVYFLFRIPAATELALLGDHVVVYQRVCHRLLCLLCSGTTDVWIDRHGNVPGMGFGFERNCSSSLEGDEHHWI